MTIKLFIYSLTQSFALNLKKFLKKVRFSFPLPGHSCKLLTKNMGMLVINEDSLDVSTLIFFFFFGDL